MNHSSVVANARPIIDKIPEDLQNEIQTNNFIVFYDIRYPAKQKQLTDPDHCPPLKKSSQMSLRGWGLAFDTHLAAYLEKHSSATQFNFVWE